MDVMRRPPRAAFFPLPLLLQLLLGAPLCTSFHQQPNPAECLCRPAPSVPQIADCSYANIELAPRCLRSDITGLHTAFTLIQFFVKDAFVSEEFYNLQVVLLDHNRLRYLVGDTFRDIPLLRELDLSHNLLESVLPEDLFEKNHRLRRLDISHNLGLGAVIQYTNDVLLHSHSLHHLNVARCGLAHLSNKLFVTPNLRELNASGNSIATLEIDAFDAMPDLIEVDLSHNLLQEFPLSHPTICVLNMSGNVIEIVDETTFGDLPKLSFLDLSLNRIKSMEYVGFPLLATMNLSRNALLSFNDSVLVDLKDSTEQPLISFANDTEKMDNVTDDIHSQIPELGVYLSTNNTNQLNASTTELNSTDRVLDLNGITYNAEQLNISGSEVNLTKLVLDLSYNRISKINIVFEWKELILVGNPIPCDCNLLYLKQWLSVAFAERDMRCMTPLKIRGLLWSHFLTAKYCPLRLYEYRNSTAEDINGGSIESVISKQPRKDDTETGMSSYNATMVALVVWGLVAYPCVVAIRRGIASFKKALRQCEPICQATSGSDDDDDRERQVTTPKPPMPPRRPTRLRFASETSQVTAPSRSPTPPHSYDVLHFQAPRFRSPLPHYQQLTPTTPSGECCVDVVEETMEKAMPNLYVDDPLIVPDSNSVEEPEYAEIYDVPR